MGEDRIANRESWHKLGSLPEARKELHLRREFTAEEYDCLARGFIPQDMDDKWFIFLETNHLYFHRSWTGHLIYQVRLRKENEQCFVDEVLVNRDPAQYGVTDDDHDVALLSFLIDNFLLGKQTPFPLPPGDLTSWPKGIYQHHVSGSGYREADPEEWKKS